MKHPARYSEPILPVLASYLEPGWSIIDRFAGTGRIHELRDLVPGLRTFGVELEPEWAHLHPDTWCGDAFDVRGDNRYDAEVVSVCYGNRFADKYNAQERCRACRGTGCLDVLDRVPCPKCNGKGTRDHHRRSYTHTLGRQLSPNSAGGLQWGPEYRSFHEAWLRSSHELVRHRLVLNISDHIRAGKRVPVVRWFLGAAVEAGFEWIGATPVPTARMKDGANRDVRVPYEMVLCFEKRQTGES